MQKLSASFRFGNMTKGQDKSALRAVTARVVERGSRFQKVHIFDSSTRRQQAKAMRRSVGVMITVIPWV